jgi:hypothetical protein
MRFCSTTSAANGNRALLMLLYHYCYYYNLPAPRHAKNIKFKCMDGGREEIHSELIFYL